MPIRLTVGDTVCPEGCCRAVSDPTLSPRPEATAGEDGVYPRPMFEVLPLTGAPSVMHVVAADYELPDGVLL